MKLLGKNTKGFALYARWRTVREGRFLKLAEGTSEEDAMHPGNESLWLRGDELGNVAEILSSLYDDHLFRKEPKARKKAKPKR